MKKQKFEVKRTAEGTAFEIAFIVLAIMTWVYVILMLNKAPEIVPTHFGPSGSPDAYGSKWNMLFPGILTTVVGFCCLAGAYFPHTVNIPGVKIANVGQANLAVRLMRIMALLMLALTAAITADTLRGHILFTLLAVAAIVIVSVVFSILIYKAR